MSLFSGNLLYMCGTCGKTYKYTHSLNRHKRYECGKAPAFQCHIPGCTYMSKRKDNLKAHVRCQHIANTIKTEYPS